MAVIPKKAATVILLRDKKPKGFEVFLLKRHEKAVSWEEILSTPGEGWIRMTVA
jgi:hypothetical protein